MNFLLYLSTAVKNEGKHPEYEPYPHEVIDEVNLIKCMYNTEFPEINDWWLPGLYRDFLKKKVVVSKEKKESSEKLSVEEFESMKKRLAENCPQKCHKCSINEGDCMLLNGWKKEGSVYKPSYKVLGKYLCKEKKVVLYVKNIDEECKGQPTYKGVLPTYIHELFHAYFHDVTEKKNAKYNKIREIEEAMVEFSTLVFIREMKDRGNNKYYWCMISDWAIECVGKKQETVGDLPAYGFGRYLFDNVPENEAFNWINKYAERLGYIDEEDELVKQYKQMVYPCYPTEPDKCLELLRKILFETNNKPIKPRDVKVNRKKNMKNEAIIDSIMCLLNEYKIEMTDPNSNKSNLDSLKYLIGQTIRAYDIQKENYHLSEGAQKRWDTLSTEDIMKKHYKDKVVCDKLSGPVEYDCYIGASKTGKSKVYTKGDKFEFREMFHEDHIIPVSMIFKEMVNMKVVNRKTIESLLNGIHICVLLKEEDRKLKWIKDRYLDLETTIKNVYKPAGISLI